MVNLLVSVMSLALIAYLVGVDKILAVLLKARPELLAAALLAYAFLNVVMSYRIKVVLEGIGERISVWQAVPSNLAGMLASDFTPARAGYFFTAFSISSRNGIALEKTILSIFGPQMFDFLIKVTCAGVLLLMLLSMVEVGDMTLNAAFLLAFLATILFVSVLVFHPPLLARLASLESIPFVPFAFAFLRRMHIHSDKVLALKEKIILITFSSWFIKGVEWFFLSRAIGISLSGNPVQDLLFIMVFQGAITIIQFLPIPTLAGAGASEAGFAAILIFFGIPFEVGVTFGFLTRLTMITVDIFSLPVILAYLRSHSLEGMLKGITGAH